MRRKKLVIAIWTLSLLLGFFCSTAHAEPMSIATAMIISGLIGAGGGIAGGLLSKGGQNDNEPNPWGEGELFRELPGYEESDAARGDWASKLQQWGGEEGYGAIPMNWDEIWNTAKNKISRYYWGGVNDTGLAGKMRASAARRNMPVNENMIGSLGQQESIDLGSLATTEATNKIQYGEQGRQGWLNSLMNLAGLKPSYITRTGVSGGGTTYGAGNMVGDVSSGIGSLFSQYSKNKMQQEENQSNEDFWSYLIGYGGGMPKTAQTSLSGYNNPLVAPPDYYSSG